MSGGISLPWPPEHRLIEFDTIDSTNEEARRLAQAGEARPLWLRADAQSAGRGRQGRAWESLTGNLFCTLMIRPDCGTLQAAHFAFAAGLAVADLLNAYVPDARITLKWPNDVLLDGAKVAGILLESAARPGGRIEWLAVGIGVNLAAVPSLPGTPYPVTALARHLPAEAKPPSPQEALATLAAALGSWHDIWARDFEPLRRAWLTKAEGLGRTISVRRGKTDLKGRFAGIDGSGNLMLVLKDDSVSRISAGDVFFPLSDS